VKLILTHKKQLKRISDVSRFLAYCYGKKMERPVVPVEGYFPGLPVGDAKQDAQSLLCDHHGGKAGMARSIALIAVFSIQRGSYKSCTCAAEDRIGFSAEMGSSFERDFHCSYEPRRRAMVWNVASGRTSNHIQFKWQGWSAMES
jgi:hypothetical protein